MNKCKNSIIHQLKSTIWTMNSITTTTAAVETIMRSDHEKFICSEQSLSTCCHSLREQLKQCCVSGHKAEAWLLTVSFERPALTSSVWFIHKRMDLHKAMSIQQASSGRSISGRYILCLHGSYSSFFLTVPSSSRQRWSILNFSYHSQNNEEGRRVVIISVCLLINEQVCPTGLGQLNQLFCPGAVLPTEKTYMNMNKDKSCILIIIKKTLWGLTQVTAH